MPEILKNEEEFRNEQAKKTAEFLDRSDAYEYFQNILSKKEEVPDFKKFKDFITRINGIARDIPISERNFDGVNVGLSGFGGDVVVPKHEDKEGLLQYAYDSIKDIDKADIKYMIPAVINGVHLFNDGNGRTSRIIHLLLGEHSSEEEFLVETQKALGRHGRFDSLDINPGLIDFKLEREVLKKHGWVFNEENPNGKIGPTSEGIGYDVRKFKQEDPKEKIAKSFFDLDKEDYQTTAIYMLMGDEGIKPLLHDYGSGDHVRKGAVSIRKMLETLSIEDWEKLVDNFYQLKKEHVQTLIDIFKKPEEHKVKRNGKEKTTKDVFIEEIQKRGNFI